MKEEIYEASLANEAILQEVRKDTQLRYAYGFVPPGYSRLTAPLFDIDRVWKLMDGAIDVHIHSGPDAYSTRVYDELEMAIQACQVGMRAVVFKCHSTPSARSAYIVQKVVNRWAEDHNKKKIDVFGGVVLNYSVGGLNPEAVIVSHRIGGKVVWLPNLDASFHRKVMGMPGGIEVLDENDHVVPPLREIFAMIAEGDMVLSLCHQSTKERFVLIDEARKMGIKRIEVAHPNQVTNKMTVDQMKIAADKGAYISFYCTSFRPLQWSWDDLMQATKVVGCDRMIAGTDCGHFMSLSPVEAMRLFIAGMLVREVPDRDIEKMVKSNPSALLY
jgi:hypothetical protein